MKLNQKLNLFPKKFIGLFLFFFSILIGVSGHSENDPDLEKKIERIVEEMLKERQQLVNQGVNEEEGLDNFFEYTQSKLGIEIHGHVQFEYEDFGPDGSRGGDSTFDNQYFTLHIQKQINEYLDAVIEIEYEHGGTSGQDGGTGGGGSGETEIDQAAALFRPLKDERLEFVFGKFYVPFGIERFSYAGPNNRLVSRPSPFQRVYPGTYADTGAQIRGFLPVTDMILKYELAVVNGLGPAVATSIRDARQGRDNNDNKAFVGRMALSFFDDALEIGSSYYDGKYNSFQALGTALVPDNTLRLVYNGVDARITYQNLDLRGEWLESAIETGGTATNGFRDFRRNGWYAQAAYRIDVDRQFFKYLDLVTRVQSKDEDSRVQDTNDTRSWSCGIGWGIFENFAFKVERQITHERGPDKIDNDAWFAQVSASF